VIQVNVHVRVYFAQVASDSLLQRCVAMVLRFESIPWALGHVQVLELLEPVDLHCLFWVDKSWSRAALAHRSRRVWQSLRQSWAPFAFTFHPGATAEEIAALESNVGQLPVGIKAIMQESQGASLPSFQTGAGDAITGLRPVSAWFVSDERAHRRFGSRPTDVRRLDIGGDDYIRTLLRTDTWELETIHIDGTVECFHGEDSLAKWIADNNSSVCCAGAYIEDFKEFARRHCGPLRAQGKFFTDAGSMLDFVVNAYGLTRHLPDYWEQTHGTAWRQTICDLVLESTLPWHQPWTESLVALAIEEQEVAVDNLLRQWDFANAANGHMHGSHNPGFDDIRRRLDRLSYDLHKRRNDLRERNCIPSCCTCFGKSRTEDAN